jgi:DNA polymerase-3 subunit epsilon
VAAEGWQQGVAAPWAELLDRDLACVDLETTGGSAARHRVIEVGVVELDRDGTQREWSTLVHPGRAIPPGITAFTGISDDMVRDAPPFASIATELRERLAGRLFVAHNARFDYGFLRAEFRRLGRDFAARTLCTVQLSRRLSPFERRHSLDAVMDRHGLACDARHRALGDARVLMRFLARLAATAPRAELEAALAALLRDRALPPWLPQTLLDELPDGPGIYRLHGAGGRLLHVGAAKNLREQVLRYCPGAKAAAKASSLGGMTERLAWEETVGELGARFAEARALALEDPAQRRRRPEFTLTLEAHATEPARAQVVPLATPFAADAERYGLFATARDAWRALEGIAAGARLCRRALGLESAQGACVAHAAGGCRGACVGAERPALHDTRVRLALAGLRLKAWPFRGRIALIERDWRGLEAWHVCAGWRHLATVGSAEAAREVEDVGETFDPASYRLLRRVLTAAHPPVLVELD